MLLKQAVVAKYMLPRSQRPPSQRWKTFLRNHAAGIASFDLLMVPTAFFQIALRASDSQSRAEAADSVLCACCMTVAEFCGPHHIEHCSWDDNFSGLGLAVQDQHSTRDQKLTVGQQGHGL